MYSDLPDEELPEVTVKGSPWPWILLTGGALWLVAWALSNKRKRQ